MHRLGLPVDPDVVTLTRASVLAIARATMSIHSPKRSARTIASCSPASKRWNISQTDEVSHSASSESQPRSPSERPAILASSCQGSRGS